MTDMMRAVFVDQKRELVDQSLPMPTPNDHDVLVKIQAISINPIDIKRIHRITALDPRILGYDAVGEVVQLGPKSQQYQVGDQIFYAGTTSRNGSYADYQLVDERITARTPQHIALSQAAAMPLTWLTAYEILIDKLGYQPTHQQNSGTILVINGAGGAGSVLVQLAKWLGLTVIATSSPANFDWLHSHGTTWELDYHDDLVHQVRQYVPMVDAVINLFDTAKYFEAATEVIRPFGHIVNVALTPSPLEITKLQAKSASFDWELMFTKANLGYDLESQGQALRLLATLLDEGVIRSTATKVLREPIDANHIQQAHQLLNAHQMVGKMVIVREDTK